MKKIILSVVALLGVGFIYLAIAGGELQEISTEIEITAPPAKVWAVISDVDNWQEWSPIIKESQGAVSLGEELTITMMGKEAGQEGPQYSPVITELKETSYFHWRAHMIAGFIFTNDKFIELKETATGTRVIHKELFKGLLAPIFCGQMEQGVPPMLNAMNKALKTKVEGLSEAANN